MRQLRLLGTALIAVFALGVVVAATASATEPGLLFLKSTETGFKFTAKGGAGELKTVAGIVKCGEVTGTGSSSETGHVVLGTGTLDFTKCKEVKGKSEVACNSEGDASETILVPIDFHLINVLKETTLEPGIAILPLPTPVFKFVCAAGTSIVEVKGWEKCLVLTANLTTDIESAEIHCFAAGEKCDSSDALCEKLDKEAPFEASLAGKFEKAELIQLATLTWTPKMLVDD